MFQGEKSFKKRNSTDPRPIEMKKDFASPKLLISLKTPVSIPEMNAPWSGSKIGSIPEKSSRIPQITVKMHAETPPISAAAKALRHSGIRFLLALGKKPEIQNHEQ